MDYSCSSTWRLTDYSYGTGDANVSTSNWERVDSMRLKYSR